ncbi:TadE/TadG family type IV pilus assembly protein [Acidocella sp.]|uniref:TadE/TadG family type IV pilus assembly protein n=1 Tax=Acidocella sp. TaxID=50710 RepID=UPI00180B5945|nr:TadE family protein [Acidocella sp.]NNM58016.1 pilus assembly protein [Acidocella sp.]
MQAALRLCVTRRASAAVEFAISGLALFAFIMAILNFGLLGFSLGTLAHSVQATARKAAVYASNQYATTGIMTCPDAAMITTFFNGYAQPPLPGAGTATGSNPLITATWTNNSSGAGGGAEWNGVYLTLTVKYLWSPVGFNMFVKGIPLSITTAATVMGSFDIPTVVSPSCQS